MPSVTLRVADAMRQSGYLPDESKDLSRVVKAKLLAILSSPGIKPFDREPIPVPSVNTNIWLSAPDIEKVAALAGKTGMSEGGVLTALLLRDFDAWKKSSMGKPVEEVLTAGDAKKRLLHDALLARGQTMRHEQKRMLAALDRLTTNSVDESRVMFVEAGTGIGKTMAYLSHALDVLDEHPDAFVAVAVPSFALIRQVRAELCAFPTRPRTTFLAGQGEWISDSALQWLLADGRRLPEDQAARLEDWMRDQKRASSENNLLPPWSRESLLAFVPEFAFVRDVTILERDSDDDPGFRAYKGQFADLGKSNLVVMTHAMLATLLKRRLIQHYRQARGDDKRGLDAVIKEWEAQYKMVAYHEREQQLFEAIHAVLENVELPVGGDLIPTMDFLVIDEAHQFEDAVSQVFSTFVSMRNLVKDANLLADSYPKVFSSSAASDIFGLERQAKEMGKKFDTDTPLFLELRDKSSLFWQLHTGLSHFLKPKKGVKKSLLDEAYRTPAARRLRGIAQAVQVLATMSETLGDATGSAAYLHWSPQRDYPRITIGRASHERELNYLWSILAHRTALVSGTLYESMPSLSFETTRRSLAIPVGMAMSMEPIHADWQIKPVTLYMITAGVEPAGRQRFVRPPAATEKDQRKALQDSWLDDVAGYTAKAYSSAVGGVLVLGTAFADLEGLSNRLREFGIDPLVHRAGVDLAGLKLEFIQQKAQGRKPILLAAGAAWTGFDLHTPNEPDLLTDLVILNAPLGVMSQTVSRLRRASQKKTGHYEVAYQALKMVRQAFGRLVRTELPATSYNRRIHWLDARIHDPKMVGLMSSIRRFMAKYKTVSASA
jgi:CRISPR type IV-associated DEAD/DEAH-box helicase Csf4